MIQMWVICQLNIFNESGTMMSLSESNVYMVENILGKRRNPKDCRAWQYFIKWDGFPNSENSWVAAKDIIDKAMLNRYNKSLKLKN